MRSLFGLSGAVCFLLVGPFSPAAAQMDEPTAKVGSRIVPAADPISADAIRGLQKKFGKCVYRRNSARAIELLENSDQRSIEYANLDYTLGEFQEKFDMVSCLTAASRRGTLQISFQPHLLRMLFAEEAYLAENDGPLTIAAGDEEVLTTRPLISMTDRASVTRLAALSDCVVFHGAEQADALVRTQPASDKETNAINELIPAISSCIFEDDKLTLTPHNIRTMVADGLWSRSHYGSGSAATVPASDVNGDQN